MALFCAVVFWADRLKRKGPTESGRLDDQSRHTGFTSKQKNGFKIDVKIAHQPGQPDEPHTEIFSMVPKMWEKMRQRSLNNSEKLII
jgi:hypothetical protein